GYRRPAGRGRWSRRRRGWGLGPEYRAGRHPGRQRRRHRRAAAARSGAEGNGSGAAREAVAGISRLQEEHGLRSRNFVFRSMQMNRSIALVVLAAAAFGVAGCVTHETRPQARINAIQASQEIPQDQLLDVAVKLFDENVPTDEKKLEQAHIFPEVRKAEARYFPMQIRNTLEGSG